MPQSKPQSFICREDAEEKLGRISQHARQRNCAGEATSQIQNLSGLQQICWYNSLSQLCFWTTDQAKNKTHIQDNLSLAWQTFSIWFHSLPCFPPSFHLTRSLIKEMPYKITFLKVSPTSSPHWGILFVWIVNIDIWTRLGTTVLLNLCMRRSPCVWIHTPLQQPTHTEIWVTQMLLNNTALFQMLRSSLYIYCMYMVT